EGTRSAPAGAELRADGGSVPPLRLQPAALGRDQDGLRPIDSAELAGDVVQGRAGRARGELELVPDLLVDLSLGEALEDLDLAPGQRARIDLTRAPGARERQVVHDRAKLLRAEADAARAAQQLGRRDRAALRVVREHVGEADECDLVARVL